MSSAVNNIDDEVGIPTDAKLSIPPSLSAPAKLIFSSSNDAEKLLPGLITIAKSSDRSSSDSNNNSANISLQSSMRDTARCIIVGRQASAADIRQNSHVVIQDLGGKHGTYVNNQRLEKHGKIELPLEGKEHTVRFDSPKAAAKGTQHASEENKDQSQSLSQPLQQSEVTDKVDETNPDEKALHTNEDASSTRESREAQIAAMIASFDAAPSYKNSLHSKDQSNEYNLPITSSITLSPGSDSFTSSDGTGTSIQSNSSVSALCFEPSGSRLVAGHRDGTLRYYAFNGMKPALATTSSKTLYAPFRIVDSYNDPLDSTGRHVVTALNVSSSGGQWIIGTTSSQPRVVDREGRTTLYHFMKGDVYVTDSSKNKGHTASVTGVAFHPLGQEICWSCSYDGSVRQWDVSGRGKTQFQKLVSQKVISKCKNEKGQRTQIVSNLSVIPMEGRLWLVHRAVVFKSGAALEVHGISAHGGTKPVTFVTFIGDGSKIASRSDSDDTVRIWNVEKMEKDSGSFSRKRSGGLPALNESANCAFSPDGTVVCAGSSVNPREPNCCGKLKFYRLPEEPKNGKPIKEAKKEKKKKESAILDPIVELDLNQIAVGTSDGLIHVLFDQTLSSKGALIPSSRSVRPSDGLSDLLRTRAPTGSAAFLAGSNANIQTPNALPLFREEARATRKVKEEPPVTGGIKTGTGAGGNIHLLSPYTVKTFRKLSKIRTLQDRTPEKNFSSTTKLRRIDFDDDRIDLDDIAAERIDFDEDRIDADDIAAECIDLAEDRIDDIAVDRIDADDLPDDCSDDLADDCDLIDDLAEEWFESLIEPLIDPR
ncbi:putative WDR70-like protein [Skeletonema marinoi]|uniref:WDR70-like protein n=1 Tax=Skeletonema marinoi TaxID=267567 RepID=A0AAD8YJZ0_9STRA|nr:putative WDR70-like protein [Skeletonema marinoi]